MRRSSLRTLVVVAQGVDHALRDFERIRLLVLRHAVVFETTPIVFALRDNVPGTVSAPMNAPSGRTFTFADPDGYRITLHDRA